MVRLHGARGDQGGRPLRQRIGHQIFELARLVAAQAESGQIVAFDQDARACRRTAKCIAQPHRIVHGGWQRREGDAWLPGKCRTDALQRFHRFHGSTSSKGQVLTSAGKPSIIASVRMSAGNGATISVTAPVVGCLKESRHACSACREKASAAAAGSEAVPASRFFFPYTASPTIGQLRAARCTRI